MYYQSKLILIINNINYFSTPIWHVEFPLAAGRFVGRSMCKRHICENQGGFLIHLQTFRQKQKLIPHSLGPLGQIFRSTIF